MEVRTAEHLGMCFGVKDAIDMALELASHGPVTILGDLVHNKDVVARMEAAGAARARHKKDVKTGTVLLTAHGTAGRVKLELEQEGFKIHDAACPLVLRVHQAIQKLVAEKRHPVIIGQAGHVEVRGLVGDLDEYSIVLNEEDLDQLEGKPRLGVVAQTTQPLECVLDLTEAIRQRVLLELPIATLCREDCAGLCSQCGHDLNLGPCDCKPEVDTRFSVLEKLLQNGSDSES